VPSVPFLHLNIATRRFPLRPPPGRVNSQEGFSTPSGIPGPPAEPTTLERRSIRFTMSDSQPGYGTHPPIVVLLRAIATCSSRRSANPCRLVLASVPIRSIQPRSRSVPTIRPHSGSSEPLFRYPADTSAPASRPLGDSATFSDMSSAECGSSLPLQFRRLLPSQSIGMLARHRVGVDCRE
jgi:hypothetical protein